MASVRLLGEYGIEGVGFRPVKSVRLLSSYLFLYPEKPHRREKLFDIFWPDLEEKQSRGAMNTACWRLKQILALAAVESLAPPQLVSTHTEVVLQSVHGLSIDVHVVEDLCARIGDAGLQVTGRGERLSELKHAYGGPFLEGEDAAWILVERERLQSLFIGAVHRLMQLYAGGGHYELAIQSARQILRIDPYRENVQHDLLILLVLAGQRVEALRHFERWRGQMLDELGIAPEPRSQRLVEQIRQGAIHSAAADLPRSLLALA